MILGTIGRIVALFRFVAGPQLARNVLLVPSRDAVMRRIGMRTGMGRFVLGPFDLQLVGAPLVAMFRRRLASPVGLMRFCSGMLLAPTGFAFPVAALQAV